jgi:hypothetical protein
MMLLEIHNSDGDTFINVVSEEDVKVLLKEGCKFFSALPSEADTNYWDGKSLLLRAEVVVPKPKKVVMDWEL